MIVYRRDPFEEPALPILGHDPWIRQVQLRYLKKISDKVLKSTVLVKTDLMYP